MKSKVILLLISLLMIFSVIACDDSQPPEEKTKYTITWVDEGGNEIAKTSVEEGTIPSYTYTKEDSAEWDYTVHGWSTAAEAEEPDAIPAASADATYYACVSAVRRSYTASFDTLGGPDVPAQTIEYGSCAEEPEAPEYEGYKFMGWFSDDECTEAADFTSPITDDTTFYALWNEKIDIAKYLEALLAGYELDPYSYVPESMRPGYAENLIDSDELVSDYSDFVGVSDIPPSGYGEQWNMIIENIEQSSVFFNALSAVEGLTTTSVAAFRNYVDKNPADTAHHSFASGIYTATIDFNGEIIYYVLDYTATFPVIGEQTAQIALVMNVESGERTCRIQLGDANALTYVMTESSYEFAIKYLGVRRAYFGFSESDDGSVYGHIYEYITVEGVEIASAADFYITDDHVSAVGNKADGMLGFTGYISELYSTENGRLIGYEVRETLSSIVYNTLWLDLRSLNGIQSIKYREESDSESAAFFINGTSTTWEAKTVGGLGAKMFSRRFDLEFRTRYFYSYDEESDSYVKTAVKLPMLFVQEENYASLGADVSEANGISLTVLTSDTDLTKLMNDYDTLVDIFITNKDSVTVEVILEFIGEKITFK